jgi:CO dehydrogenase maturation factor
MQTIKNYLRGSNQRISSAASMLKTTPPGNGSNLLRVAGSDEIHRDFLKSWESISIMATGPFSEEDLGVKCYHAKTGAVELYLNHTLDKEGEYIVVDMTAGADSFASGLFTRFDMTFVVVEPTLKSVSVYQQYKQYAQGYGVALQVIGNKVKDAEDLVFIQQQVGSDLLVAFGDSKYVRAMEKGLHKQLDDLEPENLENLVGLKQAVDHQTKDWVKYLAQAKEFHIKNALSWGNAQVGEDVTQQIDPSFQYPVA